MAIEPLCVGNGVKEKTLEHSSPLRRFAPRASVFGATRKTPLISGVLQNFKNFLVAIFQRVADGNAKSLHTRTAEFKVVSDKVKVGLRPDEDGVGHIKAESAANVGKKVVATLKIRTTNKVAGEKGLVKPKAFQTDAGLQFGLGPLAQRRTVDRIEIIEDWAVRIEKDVHVLVSAPCHFTADAKIFLDKQKITAESRITTTANTLWGVVQIVEGIGGRLSGHRAHAKGQIKLLSVCCAHAHQNQTKGRTQKK